MKARSDARLPPGPRRHDPERVRRAINIIDVVHRKAVASIEGLFKEPGTPGWNSDASKPPSEWRQVETKNMLFLVQGIAKTGDPEDVAQRARDVLARVEATYGAAALQRQKTRGTKS